MGQTFSRKNPRPQGRADVQAGEVITVSPDYYLSHDNSSAIIGEFKKLGVGQGQGAGEDRHRPRPHRPGRRREVRPEPQDDPRVRRRAGHPELLRHPAGVCHQVLPEAGLRPARPGRSSAATRTRTTYGALGAFAAGIGRTETACIWATDEIWLRVPGDPAHRLLAAAFPPASSPRTSSSSSSATTAPTGPTTRPSSSPARRPASSASASRMTLANMAAEMGAKNGYFEPDEKTLEWLEGRAAGRFEIVRVRSRRGLRGRPRLRSLGASSRRSPAPTRSTTSSRSARSPASPSTRSCIGTCTNGRLEDLEIAAAHPQGPEGPSRRSACLVLPASRAVYLEALKAALLETLSSRPAASSSTPAAGPASAPTRASWPPGEVVV